MQNLNAREGFDDAAQILFEESIFQLQKMSGHDWILCQLYTTADELERMSGFSLKICFTLFKVLLANSESIQ